MSAKADRLARWWWLGAPLIAFALYAAGGLAAQGAVLVVVAGSVAAIFLPARRDVFTRLTAMLAVGAVLDLALLLVFDQFQYSYIWRSSHVALPAFYKLANVWGGDEGTLLLLTALAALAAARLTRYRGWAGPGALALVAALAIGAAVWTPFAALPPELIGPDTAHGQGMNAHLVRVWMLLHPPFVFLAFVLFLAPYGAAAQALATGDGDWPVIAARWVRFGWLTLSVGLVAGMWWAYEDFTFGQFWHWDPVQTSVFMVWAFATAHLHTLRRYRDDGAYGRLHPLLGLATGIAALASLVITRYPALASSHRYVGETSFPWLLVLGVVLSLLTLAALIRSRHRHLAPARRTESAVLILVASLTLISCAGVAAAVLGEAYISAALDAPKPEKFKPFFEFLARWTSSAEADQLRALFDQWEVDRYRANALLAPIGIVIGLAGGHNFLPVRRSRVRWAVTVGVALAALIAAFVWQPMAGQFTGKGMTSSNTTAIFPWLDALAVTMAYLGLAALAWGGQALIRHRRHRVVGRYYVPVGAIHFGVVMALLAATVASVFDLYNWRNLSYPDDFEKPVKFPWGYEVTVAVGEEAFVSDGVRAEGGEPGFHAVAEARWSLVRDGLVVEDAEGHAVYRDERAQTFGGLGPVRLMCEIIDYRYARTVSGATQMIDPFIHRGLWRDVQIWLPALEYRVEGEGNMSEMRAPSTVPVVLKIYPMMTWMWLGLAITLIGAAVAFAFELRRVGTRQRARPPPTTGTGRSA